MANTIFYKKTGMDNAKPLYWKKENFMLMRPHPMHYFCALLCLWSNLALAENTLDPFHTEAMLPLKPALRVAGAVGDPCAETMPAGALNLLEVVNLALCNNPQTREAWASARVQAAEVGVSKASYLPSPNLTASGNRSRLEGAPSVYQRNIGLNLSYLLYDFGGRAANLENARQLLAAASCRTGQHDPGRFSPGGAILLPGAGVAGRTGCRP